MQLKRDRKSFFCGYSYPRSDNSNTVSVNTDMVRGVCVWTMRTSLSFFQNLGSNSEISVTKGAKTVKPWDSRRLISGRNTEVSSSTTM